MTDNLDEKFVVITGGARGIGRGIARVLLRRGASVAVVSRTQSDLDEAREELSDLGEANAFRCDVADAIQVKDLFGRLADVSSHLDGLVCAHGVVEYCPFLELTEQQWDRTLAINLKGAFLCGQAAASDMASAGRGGRIVFISSINGLAAEPESADYSASKAGIHLLARGMACDLARYGITINVVAPGWVKSPMSAPYLSDELLSGARRFNPVGRVGEPEDIGNAVAWLLCDESSYITGTVIPVDGGQSAVLSMPSEAAVG